MKLRSWSLAVLSVALGQLGAAAAALAEDDAPDIATGAALFMSGRFDGNGRTCTTCHVLDDALQLSIEHVDQTFARRPNEALFRAVDSDHRDGASYSMFLDDGLARVNVVLPPNVTVDEVDGIDVRIRPDGRYVVTLRRSTPSVLNAALQEHLTWDGRNGSDLAAQATGAVLDHAEGTPPTPAEADAMAAFQRLLFSRPELRAYARGGPAPALPPGTTDSERRGRAFFVSSPLSASQGTRGLCATCHSGPMLNRTNEFNPGDPPGLAFAGNRVSEKNARNMPVRTYRIRLPQDLVVMPGLPVPIPPGTVIAPAGTPIAVRTADPGALIVDTDPLDGVDAANPCISSIPCILGAAAGTTTVFQRIPSLWGIGRTAPYFHDNSAPTLEDAVRHYRFFFAPTIEALLGAAAQLEAAGDTAAAAGLRDIAGALVITDQDVTDIAAFLRLL